MSLFSLFYFAKNEITPKKIQILTNVMTSTPEENIKIYDDFFVRMKKCILKGVFGFGSIGFVVICYYTFSNKIEFLLSFFDPLKCILAYKEGHIFNQLF